MCVCVCVYSRLCVSTHSVGGHEDAAGNWVPEEDEEEADSDDEWADTGQTRRKQTTEDALDALTLNEYNGGPIDDDDDLLLTDREQVLLFGGGLTGYFKL